MAELRWCPAHKGVLGNEKADEWAKLAADEPDAHTSGLGGTGDQPGQRRQPSRSLAHLKRSITEAKWQEANVWAESKEIPAQPTPGTTPESGLGPSKRQQAACREVLLAEDGPLPHWPIPGVGEEVSHR